MFRSEWEANQELKKLYPAYKLINLDGKLAREALRKHYANQPKGIARIVAKIASFFLG